MKICFFTTTPKEKIKNEQYTINDIWILNCISDEVVVSTNFFQIPWFADLYFSWWATGSILPLIVAKICSRKIIVVAGGNEAMLYRDSISSSPKGYLASSWYKKMAVRLTLRYADQVLIVSDFMKDHVNKLGGRKVTRIYNAIDTDKFRPSERRRSGIVSIFNFYENVIELKRGYILLEAFKEVAESDSSIMLTVIGKRGNGYEPFLKRVDDLGLDDRVNILSAIPNQEVVQKLSSSKAYIQISDTETFGVAIAEAMSCGTPVIVSRRGAIPEVAGDCGFYVDHNDPRDVARGIKEVLNMNEEALNRMGKKCRKRIVENFSIKIREEKIKRLIEQLI